MKKRSSEKRRHVVSWLNKAEWTQVQEYLYSKDPALQKFALQRISAWKCRYAGSSPVAVDCTADLVRCQVLDRFGQLNSDDLVLLYGAALVRFVNLITERQQGKVARPLRRLAGNLNIPEWVVDLRHEVTHRKLPTLKWCRKGCNVVLEWLQHEYWSRQMGGVGGPEGEDWESQLDGEDEEMDLRRQEDELIALQKEREGFKKARELLISFEKVQFQVPNEVPQDRDGSPLPFADMSWLLGEIKQFALESSDLLIDAMLEDGFLVPTVEQLEALGCDFFFQPTEPRLPQTFLRFWLPLLKMLNSPAFIHLLLEKVFAELKLLFNEQSNHRVFYLSAWISEIILCNSKKVEYRFETKNQKKSRLKDRIFVNRLQLRWQQLLSACLDAPCVSTPHLLQLIMDDMEHPLPVETRGKLLQLCSIYTQTSHSNSDPSPERHKQPTYTLESLKRSRQNGHSLRPRDNSEQNESSQEFMSVDALAETAKVLRGSPWQVCTDRVLWKNHPLGKVPGQSDDPSCLMVENYSTMTVFDQPVEMERNMGHSAAGVSAPVRTGDGLLWSHSDLNKLKTGLQLF
ncbi:ribosomal biogenesis protein LAS1L [Cynoglossus semilaevis]|uniref:LAS1 like ribosome biogenesis factor n=1 Tax=Cynoglossus semilaevis TaxID=244447 RepID=A0A3P8UP59_CYNSE|nr:ribosomal biogenesis protein LAS1L [Cynoglossus semilaevis]